MPHCLTICVFYVKTSCDSMLLIVLFCRNEACRAISSDAFTCKAFGRQPRPGILCDLVPKPSEVGLSSNPYRPVLPEILEVVAETYDRNICSDGICFLGFDPPRCAVEDGVCHFETNVIASVCNWKRNSIAIVISPFPSKFKHL